MSFDAYGNTPAAAMQQMEREYAEGRVSESHYRTCMTILKALHDLQVPPYGLYTTRVEVQSRGYSDQADFLLTVQGALP